jgi:hypothetical protein
MNITAARNVIGTLLGLDRPITRRELGIALRLKCATPETSVMLWETGKSKITGPASVAIELFMQGYFNDELKKLGQS